MSEQEYFLIVFSFPNINEEASDVIFNKIKSVANKDSELEKKAEPYNKGYTYYLFVSNQERYKIETFVPTLEKDVCAQLAQTQVFMSIYASKRSAYPPREIELVYAYYFNKNNDKSWTRPGRLTGFLDKYESCSKKTLQNFIVSEQYLGVLADISSVVVQTKKKPKSFKLKDWISHMANNVPAFLKRETAMPNLCNHVREMYCKRREKEVKLKSKYSSNEDNPFANNDDFVDDNEDSDIRYSEKYLGGGRAMAYYVYTDVHDPIYLMPMVCLCPELIEKEARGTIINYDLLFTKTLVHEFAHALMDTFARLHRGEEQSSIYDYYRSHKKGMLYHKFLHFQRKGYDDLYMRERFPVFYSYGTLPEIAMEESMANCVALQWVKEFRSFGELNQVRQFVRSQPAFYRFGEFQYLAGADWQKWYNYKYLPIDDNLRKWFRIYFDKGNIVKQSAANYQKVDFLYALRPDMLSYAGLYKKSVFLADSNIKECAVPANVIGIDSEAFANCSKLELVNLPDGLRYIESDAFAGCTKLSAINIPDSVEYIGSGAFWGCKSLKQLTLPKSLHEIGASALPMGCKITSNSPNFIVASNMIVKNNTVVLFFGDNKKVAIPQGVTKIGEDAFRNCGSIQQVDIPNSVTEIGKNAFWECDSLQQVDISNPVTKIGEYAFWGCKNLIQINLPQKLKCIPKYAFSSCTSLAVIKLPDCLEHIEEYAFDGCNKLTTINLPNSLTCIDKCAFGDCKSLKQLTLPQSLQELGTLSLPKGCKITSNSPNFIVNSNMIIKNNTVIQYLGGAIKVVIPQGVTEIGKEAFRYCDSIQQVDIPNTVKVIGEDAFASCKELTSVNLSVGLTTLDDGAFSCCYKLKNITLPDGLKSIGMLAFCLCTSLQEIHIPNTVSNVGDRAFDRCGVQRIVVPLGEKTRFQSILPLDLCDKVEEL